MKQQGKIIGSVDDLTDGEAERLFFAARTKNLGDIAYPKPAVLMTAFFEPSTRTRLSFEMAAHRLGIRVLNFNAESSSLEKGESYGDTLLNLLSLKPDVLVVRSSFPFYVPSCHDEGTSIINGGDGVNEHPTQALTDCFTLLNHWQTDNLRNKKILIVGDIAHSRVARSNIKLLNRFGASVYMLAPKNYSIESNFASNINSFGDIDGSIDAVMCLRLQKERILKGHALANEEYIDSYSLTLERFLSLGEHCVVLHPGPINLGVEIEDAVKNHSRSLILEQVKHGVSVRAALILHCINGGIFA